MTRKVWEGLDLAWYPYAILSPVRLQIPPPPRRSNTMQFEGGVKEFLKRKSQRTQRVHIISFPLGVIHHLMER